MPLSAGAAATIKENAGKFEGDAGIKFTVKMYDNAFSKYPAIKDEFVQANHVKDSNNVTPQGKLLAEALVAFAKNCDNEAALGDTVDRIAKRHKVQQVKDASFPVLGECLLQTMKEELGADAALCDAWREGYNYLAELIMAATKKQ